MLVPSVFMTAAMRSKSDPKKGNRNTGEEIMPKIKTNRSAAKRFRKTGSGKYVFGKSHHSHILTKKTTKRKRSLRQMQLIKASDMKEVRRLLPNG